MPHHSSKNFYKAEYMEDVLKEREQWANWNHSWSYWDDYLDYQYCYCTRREMCHLCYTPAPPTCECCGHSKKDCTYPYKNCPCDACLEYTSSYNRKELILDYFTPEQLLQTLQEHLKQTNCWCYDRERSENMKWRIKKEIRARRSSQVVFIPKVLDLQHVPPCVVQILDKRLQKELIELHQRYELLEKQEILAKYGITIDEYKQWRIERPDLYDKMNAEENPIVLPKQKFVKVKESTLKEGDF